MGIDSEVSVPQKDHDSDLRPFVCTRLGFKSGFIKGIPLAISIGGYGLLVGVLAKEQGFTLNAATAMSLIVFAGTAQFAALEMWNARPALGALFLETLIINSRHLLMGLTLEPWYKNASRFVRYLSAFFMIDESWALTLREFEAGHADAGFLVGSGFVMYIAWGVSTFIGFLVSSFLLRFGKPETLALDVVLPCVLVTLVVPRWQGYKKSLAPWIGAAVVAALAARFKSTQSWSVLLGGISGGFVGWIVDRGR
jgi:4-azaleucine resistance transporter AzlC